MWIATRVNCNNFMKGNVIFAKNILVTYYIIMYYCIIISIKTSQKTLERTKQGHQHVFIQFSIKGDKLVYLSNLMTSLNWETEKRVPEFYVPLSP